MNLRLIARAGLAALIAAPAAAGERVIDAFSPLVVVGQHEVVSTDGTTRIRGNMQGPLYVTSSGEPREEGTVSCAITLRVDSATLQRQGAGVCTLLFVSGGRIAADINCASEGTAECLGEFIITSGDGPLEGATGRGPVKFHTRNKGYRIGTDGSLTETIFGVAYWNGFVMTTPD